MIHLARLRAIMSQARELATAAEDFAIAIGNRDVTAARVDEDALPPSSLATADRKVSEAEWKYNYMRDGLRRLTEPTGETT